MVINIMKRSLIVTSTLAIIVIMVSTVTAVPQIQGTSTLNIINNIENNKSEMENNIEKIVEKVENNPLYASLRINISGLIDFLIRLIEFILRISGIIASILNTINFIYSIVSQLNYFISTIIQILEWLDGFLNPQGIIKNN